ncbi:hypothetical protein K8I28_12955 [bacterium]|nr:hypothetical protein [bacterium]
MKYSPFFLVTMLLVLVTLIGCDSNPSGSSTTEPDELDTLIPLSDVLEGSHHATGAIYHQQDDVFLLFTNQWTWQQNILGERISLISGTNIHHFMALEYDIHDNGYSIVANQIEGLNATGNRSGQFFWITGSELIPRTPSNVQQDAELLEAAIRDRLNDWGENFYDENDILISPLGGSENSSLYWLSVIPESVEETYDPDLEKARAALIGYNGSSAWFEATMSAPNGFDQSTLNISDFDGDGITDYLSIRLFGEGAPAMCYYYDDSAHWRWVGQFWN